MKSSAGGRNPGNIAANAKAQQECYERFLVYWEERGYSDKFEFLGGRTSTKGKIKIRCKLCGHEFEVTGQVVQMNSNLRCKYCWMHRNDTTNALRDYKLTEHVVQDYESGSTIKSISRKYNLQERVISKMLHDHNIECNPNRQIYKGRETSTQTRNALIKEYKLIAGDMREWRNTINKAFKLTDCLEKLDKQDEKANKQIAAHEPVLATCKQCGRQWAFFPSSKRYGRKKCPPTYCTKKCRNKSNRRNDHGNYRHRAHQYGVAYEPGITLRKVYQKDGGVCYLCGNRTDYEDTWNINGNKICGNSYPSIDHVIPMSKGGGHTWDNVRLACKQCNSLKGTKTENDPEGTVILGV